MQNKWIFVLSIFLAQNYFEIQLKKQFTEHDKIN